MLKNGQNKKFYKDFDFVIIKMEKDIEKIKKDIEEFIEFNKLNDKDTNEMINNVCKIFNAEVYNEFENFDVTIKDKIEFNSDWSGDEIYVDLYIEDLKDDKLNEENKEKLDILAREFVDEYLEMYDFYYMKISKFWQERGYKVNFDELDLEITNDDFIIRTMIWNQKDLNDFEIEKLIVNVK